MSRRSERPLREYRALGLVLVLVVVIGLGQAQAQSGEPARRIFDLTNQDRVSHGLAPLQWNTALARSAQQHAGWMVREPNLSHQYAGEPGLLDRAAAAGAHFRAVAENIATGPGAEAIEKEWMHSPPHRANILDSRMDALGVAVAEQGGSWYAVEDFAQTSQPLPPGQVAARVRDLLQDQGVDPSAPPQEAEQACRMQQGMPPGTHARSMVRFQTPDLSRLPGQVIDQIHSSRFARAAVAACTPEGNQAEFTVYRVAILFY